MAERSPGPLMNMSPAGLPGLLVVLVVVVGTVGLFGRNGVLGLVALAAVSLGLAYLLRRWHSRHPLEASLPHVNSERASPPRKS